VNEAIIIHVPKIPISQFCHILSCLLFPEEWFESYFPNLKQFRYHAPLNSFRKKILEIIYKIAQLERGLK
ncbi:MAG: hypothetical protein ACXU9K_11750, partial [Thermodesulfobacteriota bacterium]